MPLSVSRLATIGVVVTLLSAAACERRTNEELGVGLLDEAVERTKNIDGPVGTVPPGTRVTVCTRFLLMPRARCDGWVEARNGAITGTQLFELVRLQARLPRVKKVRALRLGTGADPNIDGIQVLVDNGPADFAPLVVRDQRGQLLLFVDGTAH